MVELDFLELARGWLVCFVGGYGCGLTIYIMRRVGDAL